MEVTQTDLGWLESVDHRVLQNKSYLHLCNPTQPVCTLVLGNRAEQALDELKVLNHIYLIKYIQNLLFFG